MNDHPDDVVLECQDVWKVFGLAGGRLAADADAEAVIAREGLAVAVREVSLSIRRGETFCLMGLSGSGKSTLVRCMTGLLPLSRGQLRVLGTDIARAAEAELVELRRHRTSMVFQDFALLPHLTVLENVAFPLRVRGVARREREAKAREMTALVGLDERENYYPHELSGGQQQRVGIARSLTTDPQLWFLDEPFSALDPLIRQDLQDEVLRLQALLHKTIVFITHDFDEAIRLASRIAIMKDGRVVQVGTPEELVLAPADEYVARFTRKVALVDVVRVGTVMRPGEADGTVDDAVTPGMLVREVAARIVDGGRPVAVTDSSGGVLGVLEPAAVTALLLGRRPVRAA